MADAGPNAPMSFLGAGWRFPPEFVKQSGTSTGEVRMTSNEEDIEASLRILLSTAAGERFLNPKYGLDLRDQLFESLGTTALNYLKDRVRDGILIYEPRIDAQVSLDDSRATEGVILLILDYTVRTTNSRYNLVFPFYQSGDAIELSTQRALAAPDA